MEVREQCAGTALPFQCDMGFVRVCTGGWKVFPHSSAVSADGFPPQKVLNLSGCFAKK